MMVVMKMKNSKMTDVYEMSNDFIKKIIHVILVPLTYIINFSLKEGVSPDQLKLLKVSPIHKTEDRMNLKNYRPISVVPVFSKIFLIYYSCTTLWIFWNE